MSLHPLTLRQFEMCPGSGVLCLFLQEIRWEINALAAGILRRRDSINQCLTACPTLPAGLHHHPELRHRIRTEEFARKTASQPADTNLRRVLSGALGCGSATTVM